MENKKKEPLRIDYKTASLYDWQKFFATLYDKQNSTRTPENLWLNAIQDMSKVAEGLRKQEYNETLKNLCYVFCWSAVFAIDSIGSMDEIVWSKFPGVCLYCSTKDTEIFSPCQCNPSVEKKKNKKPDKDLRQYFVGQKEKMPKNLDQWVEMFINVFGGKQVQSNTDITALHLFEEMGEVPETLQELNEFNKIRFRIENEENRKQLSEHFENAVKYEIADVFSWICSVSVQLLKIINEEKKTPSTFGEELSKQFPNKCWRCGKNPCQCTIEIKLNRILKEYGASEVIS